MQLPAVVEANFLLELADFDSLARRALQGQLVRRELDAVAVDREVPERAWVVARLRKIGPHRCAKDLLPDPAAAHVAALGVAGDPHGGRSGVEDGGELFGVATGELFAARARLLGRELLGDVARDRQDAHLTVEVDELRTNLQGADVSVLRAQGDRPTDARARSVVLAQRGKPRLALLVTEEPLI